VAASYRAPEVVERERRLAAELVRRLGLRPPVDVRALVESRAEISEEPIPARCDAVVVRLHQPGERPLVLLDPTGNWRRQRFTLGHELGHLLLPWHLGTLFCAVDTGDLIGEYAHRRAESEANRFAAELLVPQAWLQQILGASADLPEIAQAIYDADVTAHVACLQLARVLEAGWVFGVLDEDEHAELTGASPGTTVKPPPRGERLAPSFDHYSDERHLIGLGSRTVVWWHFGRRAKLPIEPADSRSSTDILRALVERHAPPAEQGTLFNRINGAVGYAYGKVRDQGLGPEELAGLLRSRFAGRDLPDALLADSLIDDYLAARAYELTT
jgi:hypothetical protein